MNKDEALEMANKLADLTVGEQDTIIAIAESLRARGAKTQKRRYTKKKVEVKAEGAPAAKRKYTKKTKEAPLPKVEVEGETAH